MKRTYLATSVILVGAMIVCAGCENAPAASTGDSASGAVATKSGQLRGAVGDGIASFKGIPYGASTAGSGRFKPPQKVQPWRDVRDATAFGPICPQRGVVATGADGIIGEGGTENTGLGSIPKLPQSEDCLVLNVWTPGPAANGRRPVMVWLHGRGWAQGAGSEHWYDGTALAKRGDIVVVTINHRLNVFGYLYLAEIGGDEFAGSGSAGLLDVVQALEWVRDNIQAFGGDPGNVTIFGESGGGWKVSTLLGMPAAKGLFHKAVIESGPGLTGVDHAAATAAAKRVMEQVGAASVADLQAVPGEKLLDAIGERSVEGGLLHPTVDGRTLPAHPFTPVAAPTAAGVPLLIGTNKDERALFLYNDQKRGNITDAELVERIKALVGDHADKVLSVYRKTRPTATPWDLLVAISSDYSNTGAAGSIKLAERKAAASPAPVFLYRFDWETDFRGGALKSPHALEVPFVFHNVDFAPITGTKADKYKLEAAVSDAWIAFARTGNPTHEGIPKWLPYSSADRATMILDVPSRLEHDPRPEERVVWEGIEPR